MKNLNHEMQNLVLVFTCFLTIVTAYQRINNYESSSNNSVLQKESYLPDRLTKFTKLLPPASQNRRANTRQHKKRKHKRRHCGPTMKPSRRSAYEVDEGRMTVPQIIQKYKYPVEDYTVVTKDGYLLTLHRIPWGAKSPKNGTRPAALLMHGLFASSSDYIINGPELSLAYLMADAGYDVWLGNARGNRYSRKHKTLNPANMAFWDFSFHEIGIFDLPAMIDFILNKTELPAIFYIGHSQGTTVFYILCSEHPEYNSKIIASVSLAPVAYMTHITSPFFKLFAMFSNTIGLVLDMVGIGEFRPNSQLLAQLGHMLCKDTDFTQFLCTAPMFLMGGFRAENFNKTRIPLYMAHSPGGASSRQIIHFHQLHSSGKFRYFDYGLVENLAQYKSTQPPSYKLANVKVPVILVYSVNDWLAHVKDVEQLHSELPNSRKFEVEDKKFFHSDFMYGLNARQMVHEHVIRMLKEYQCTKP